jgi:hypothetical protein
LSAALHPARGWAVSGPPEAAQQRPKTTNDDNQAHGPIASDQQDIQLTEMPDKTQGKKTGLDSMAISRLTPTS